MHGKLQIEHHQNTNIQFFIGWMPFSPRNALYKSTFYLLFTRETTPGSLINSPVHLSYTALTAQGDREDQT